MGCSLINLSECNMCESYFLYSMSSVPFFHLTQYLKVRKSYFLSFGIILFFNSRLCCKCWIELEIFHRRWYFPALCLHCLSHAPTQHKLWIASFFNLKNNKNIWTLFIHLFTIYTIYITAPRVVRRSRGCCSYLSHLHCHPPPKSHSPHHITQSQTSSLKLFKSVLGIQAHYCCKICKSEIQKTFYLLYLDSFSPLQ